MTPYIGENVFVHTDECGNYSIGRNTVKHNEGRQQGILLTLNRFYFHFALASLLILTASCTKEEPVQPPPPPPPPTEPDTTTHDYTWETIYIGDAQSYLSDVFAVSDSDVWVVGEFYLKDSTGLLDRKMYNAIHWNGKEWKPLRIKWYYQGDSGVANLSGVFGFGSYDVWSCSGIKHYDGKNWKSFITKGIGRGAVQKIWGLSTQNLYFAGNVGTILKWNGSNFIAEETNTTIDLTDVYGNANEVWAVGGNSLGSDGIVLRKTADAWEKVDTLSTWSIHSVWCDTKGITGKGFLAFAGDGIRYYDSTWRKPPEALTGGRLGWGDLYFNSIRGSAKNNVFAIGEFGIVLHYNGRTWHMYDELFRYPKVFILKSVSVTMNTVFIVGVDNSRGFVLIGKKK